MKTETLILAGSHPQGYSSAVQGALKTLAGVRDVLVIEAKNECSVLFDENQVDSQGLRDALNAAGFATTNARPAHGKNGSCCGSCGG